MKTYLVTGGAGFIGSHLVDALLENGCYVKVYDNFSTGSIENLAHLVASENSKLEIFHGDIRDSDKLSNALVGVHGVFHLAALVSVPQSIEEPNISFDINSKGTQLVLNEARKLNLGRVVIASSAAVYGDCQNVPLTETEETTPLSPYGLDKLIGEQLGRLYSSLYGMNVSCMRFFNVFGPRQPPDSPYSGVVSIFANKASINQSPSIFGEGDQTRDFVFVKDVVAALVNAMNSTLPGFRVYNVGTGQGITVNRLWDIFRKIAQSDVKPEYQPARFGDIKNSVADVTLIKTELNFSPSVCIEDNLFETYKWSLGRIKQPVAK